LPALESVGIATAFGLGTAAQLGSERRAVLNYESRTVAGVVRPCLQTDSWQLVIDMAGRTDYEVGPSNQDCWWEKTVVVRKCCHKGVAIAAVGRD
jgi:hypothetical protein